MNDLSVDKNVLTYLQEFGLNDKEIVIYLSLLKYGPNTIMDLARKTGIKRSTTHNNVEELIKKGLVSQTNYGERRMVIAEDPDKLKFLLEQRKWEVSKLERNMDGIVNSIYEMVPKARENTFSEVKFYQGEKGFKEVCQRSLDKAKGEILFISNLNEWYKVYTKEYDEQHYVPTRIKKKLKLRMLAIESDLTVGMKKNDNKVNRETRFMKKDNNFNSTIIIYNNEVSIMTSSEPYTAILIQDKEVYQTFLSIFKTVWESAA